MKNLILISAIVFAQFSFADVTLVSSSDTSLQWATTVKDKHEVLEKKACVAEVKKLTKAGKVANLEVVSLSSSNGYLEPLVAVSGQGIDFHTAELVIKTGSALDTVQLVRGESAKGLAMALSKVEERKRLMVLLKAGDTAELKLYKNKKLLDSAVITLKGSSKSISALEKSCASL